PVVGISWWEANAYCRWLKNHWNDPAVHNQRAAPFAIQQVRLPLESQWVQAAGGMKPEDRYPWEEGGIRNRADLSARANTIESRLNKTTPVWMYPRGESTRGVRDMAGNVWEWQANYYDKSKSSLVIRGGSWDDNNGNARVAARSGYRPSSRYASIGFRVCVLPA
ncbi:MAG TPA: SUMF1/EgtB/PvdO family nonheme iron enzyme, partial [Anaerolineaceae bacterium]|nr:SUMF1/EgtB/PvdO family nonheme iron enzyme [Anaerolineaceae bacterium]